LRFIDGAELARCVPMEAAIAALDRMFRGEEPPDAPQRTHLPVAGGELLLMPATGARGTGVKLVTVNPSNAVRGLPLIHGLYALFAPDTLAPVAIVDGAALTGLRTAAVSGLATRYLARPDARRLVIFGAGVQARAHLDAMRAARPIAHTWIVSRTREKAERLVAYARDVGLDAAIAGPEAVAEADIVCACTTSPTPLFDGSLLREGAHVNAVGAYTRATRELDDATMRRGRLVVETREAALAEAGDLIIPLDAGIISRDDIVADLSALARGTSVRRSPADITVFKSVGLASEDLAVAAAAVEKAQ